VKVIGHFNVEFLVGDPDGPDGPHGFFKYFRDLWDEEELGPRPADNLLDLLERGADGKPLVENQYAIAGMKEYWACLNNPRWRAVLKAWVRAGIRRGADGFIANYFYRHNCLCPHCVLGFKDYLRDRYSPDQLRERPLVDVLAVPGQLQLHHLHQHRTGVAGAGAVRRAAHDHQPVSIDRHSGSVQDDPETATLHPLAVGGNTPCYETVTRNIGFFW
jgi:hypothetical protein